MADLPPGFQFYPSDEDLVVHFLCHKASAHLSDHHDLVPTLDLFDPWELEGRALRGGNHWYFFARTTENRVTENGYWEAEAKDADQPIKNIDNRDIGRKKTFVFYTRSSGHSEVIRTRWVMHEFHLLQRAATGGSIGSRRRSRGKSGQGRKESQTWVICRVYDASSDTQDEVLEDCIELSCLDEEAYDDMDDISWPN